MYVVRAFRTFGLAIEENVWLIWFEGSGCDCLLMQAAAVPVGMSWMWTLAFGYHEDRTPSHGYAATREAAMAAFAKSWEPSDQCRSGPESATRLKVTRISSGRRNRFHRRQLERRAGDQTPAALYDDRELAPPGSLLAGPFSDYALRWKVQGGGARVCSIRGSQL